MKMKYEDFVKKLIEKYPNRDKGFVIDSLEESPKNFLRVDEEVEQLQVTKLHKTKAERDEKKVPENLEQIHKTYRTEESFIPSILEAVKTYVALNEIYNVLRKKFGEYNEPIVV